MDSYNLFEHDGSGMVGGSAPINPTDNFTDRPSPNVNPAIKDPTSQSFQSGYTEHGGLPHKGLMPSAPGQQYYNSYAPRPPVHYNPTENLYALNPQSGSGLNTWPRTRPAYPNAPPQSYSFTNDQKINPYTQKSMPMGMHAMPGGNTHNIQSHYGHLPPQELYNQGYPNYNEVRTQAAVPSGQANYRQAGNTNAYPYYTHHQYHSHQLSTQGLQSQPRQEPVPQHINDPNLHYRPETLQPQMTAPTLKPSQPPNPNPMQMQNLPINPSDQIQNQLPRMPYQYGSYTQPQNTRNLDVNYENQYGSQKNINQQYALPPKPMAPSQISPQPVAKPEHVAQMYSYQPPNQPQFLMEAQRVKPHQESPIINATQVLNQTAYAPSDVADSVNSKFEQNDTYKSKPIEQPDNINTSNIPLAVTSQPSEGLIGTSEPPEPIKNYTANIIEENKLGSTSGNILESSHKINKSEEPSTIAGIANGNSNDVVHPSLPVVSADVTSTSQSGFVNTSASSYNPLHIDSKQSSHGPIPVLESDLIPQTNSNTSNEPAADKLKESSISETMTHTSALLSNYLMETPPLETLNSVPVNTVDPVDNQTISHTVVSSHVPLVSEISKDPYQFNDEVAGSINIDKKAELDTSTDEMTTDDNTCKSKTKESKAKKPRKPREPKPKQEVDPNAPLKKERKRRAPNDPSTPKRKYTRKTDQFNKMQSEATEPEVMLPAPVEENKMTDIEMEKVIPEEIKDPDTLTDFDDIPVSKIAIKDLLEESKAKSKLEEENSPQPKRGGKSTNRKSTSSAISKKIKPPRKGKKNSYTLESDGEGEDLVTTPPPSPTKSDCDSSKRRSTRKTQRIKYNDEYQTRYSDDDEGSKLKRQKQADISALDNDESLSCEGSVNINGDGSMIVQHVLACRMTKREVVIEEVTPQSQSAIGEENSQTSNISDDKEPCNSDEKVKEEADLISENEDTTENELNIKSPETMDSNEGNSTKVEENENPDETVNEENDMESESASMDAPDKTAKDFEDESTKEEQEKDLKEEVKDENVIKKTAVIDVEEYYIKYRHLSYLHCEWRTENELYEGDRRIASKIKRFKMKQAQQLNIFEMLDDEPFNPDYIEVDRLLDSSETIDEDSGKMVKRYLVKWKSLQYEESTWELEEDVDVEKIKIFEKFSKTPPKEKWKYKRRPTPDQWKQLKDTPIFKGGNSLREYQLEGLNWLLFSWYNSRNCILADEMGLGKTIQSLTFVNAVHEYGIRGPFLIIAPLSTIPNWQREFENWTDLNIIVYHGSQQSKSMLKNYEFYYKTESGNPIKEIVKFNVLITTFEIIVTDCQDLCHFNWRVCVIDEAHRLKNRNCKLLEGLRQLNLEHRVLLSGTPLQNNVNELFSLLNFLEPSQFANNEAFLGEFGQLKTESEVLKLQALLKPMMLRRLKEDVEKSLGPKEETIVEVELTNIQKKYYRGILERNFSFLVKGTASAANIPKLMNTMMELRKCCIHPYLINGAEDQITYDYRQTHGDDSDAYYKALIQSCGKMVLIDKLLPKLKSGGHKVLIFSQMVKCLDILEDYLIYRKYPFERIDGRIRGNLRQEAIDRFSKPDSDRFVFLLCTKAGGLGINLTAADTVIIYDSDWNPQNDLQAQARCHRIGQQKLVKIYRLICQNTYEREMFDKASMKLGLDKAVLQSMNTSSGKETTVNKQLSKTEIEDLLKKGAYGAVMDEDNAADKFCEEDIEQILARRTKIIQLESEKGSTFSKASFSANNLRCDIDIHDPDFWNKWAKKAEVDTTEKKEEVDLIVNLPRRRTIIKRYGQDEEPNEISEEEASAGESDDDNEGLGLRSKKLKDKLRNKKNRKYHPDDYIPRHEILTEEVVYGGWARSECFKIERGLLTYGWGRWSEVIDTNQFRKGWTHTVVEDCARIIVLYCLRHYKGDEKILNFIWDLIEPCENGEVTISRNHSGLHNPVPRGRNARKKLKEKAMPKVESPQKWENADHWSSEDKYDCENYLEKSFKKHLLRHANKVLLRIRMMYYIKQEIIGDFAQDLEKGTHASSLGIRIPRSVDGPPPRTWWDNPCDVSLLVGTYLHGYENYLPMRSDPQLEFMVKLGPPNDEECSVIKNDKAGGVEEGEESEEESGTGGGSTEEGTAAAEGTGWPSMQELNARVRRLISAYQRNYKKEELKQQQYAKKAERKERMENYVREEVSQWKWAKADEEAFRRTVASYGVEFDPITKSLKWARFRHLAGLETKTDDNLTEYLKAFMAMCKKQCGLSVGEAELPTRDFRAEPISEERAFATLERIDLLRVLREEIAINSSLDDKLKLCKASGETPPWWQPGKHDKLLVLAICKHGLEDSYNKVFLDPNMPFAECYQRWVEKKGKSIELAELSSSSRRNTRRSGVLEPGGGSVWFDEKSLEARLHHLAHLVQNLESEKSPSPPPAFSNRSQQISIDVETERAKLQAILSQPQQPLQPPPPPAHQSRTPTPSSSNATSAQPLDLTHADSGKNKQLDLSNKGKKRKKLDDIISGLCAKKTTNTTPSKPITPLTAAPSISSTISPDVTVTKVTSTKQPFVETPSLTVTRITAEQHQAKSSSNPYEQSMKQDKKSKTILLDQLAKDSKWMTGDWYSQANLASLMRPDLSIEDRRSSSSSAQNYKKSESKSSSSKMSSSASDYANMDLSNQLLKDLQRQAAGASSSANLSSAAIDKQMKSLLNNFSSNLAYYSAASQNLAGLNYPTFDPSFASLSSLDNKQLAATLSSLASFGTNFDTKMLNNYLKSLDSSKYGNPSQKHSHSSSDKKRYSSGLGGLEITKQDSSGGGSSSKDKQSVERSQTPKSVKTPTTPDYSHYPFALPNSLYASMGMGGLNPFSSQAGLTSAYEAMLAQSGLLNGSLTKDTHSSSKNKYKSSSSSSSSKASSSLSYANFDKTLLSSLSSAGIDPSKFQGSSSLSIDAIKKSIDVKPSSGEKRYRSEQSQQSQQHHQPTNLKTGEGGGGSHSGEMDIEDLIAPTTVIRSGAQQSPEKNGAECSDNQPLDLANNKNEKKHDSVERSNVGGNEESHDDKSRDTSASSKSPD